MTAEDLVRLAKKLDVQARKVTVARGKLSEAMLLDLIQGPFKQVAFNLHRTDPATGRRDKIRVAAHVGS